MVDMAYPRDDARFRDGNGDTDIDVVGDPDDPPVRDVPDDRVDHFSRYGWVRVEDLDAADDSDAAAGDDADAESEPEPESEPDAESESDGHGNAAEGFDAASFVDRNVDPIDSDVRSGEYDNVLDEIEAAEKADGSPRNTVMDAIESRRGA